MPREFAPGIPAERRIEAIPLVAQPRRWEFTLHEHFAERAGRHFDLRLGDPRTQRAHSWAMRSWPSPGERTLAIQQPTHTLKYMSFTGVIEDGYGKGRVAIARREKVEILRASNEEIRFNLYPGRDTEEYLLRKTGQGWLLINSTPTRQTKSHLPKSKPKYKVTTTDKLDANKKDTVWQAKIDGAHTIFDFERAGGPVRIYSYRETKRQGGLINHAPRIPGFHRRRVPGQLGRSMFRGELYAVGKDGRAIPAARIGGILNAGVWLSRQKQKGEGKLVAVVFDVIRWKGKDVSDRPFSEKRQMLAELRRYAPWLKVPRTAVTPGSKLKMLADIASGREKSTEEGVIEWRKDDPVPAKAKLERERDVWVRKVFAETGDRKGLAGGFEYSLTETGPIIGRVGSGFTHSLKKDMLENPGKYEGMHAKIRVTPGPASYAPRMAVFAGWHLDQDMPADVKMAAVEAGMKLAFTTSVADEYAPEGRLRMRPAQVSAGPAGLTVSVPKTKKKRGPTRGSARGNIP